MGSSSSIIALLFLLTVMVSDIYNAVTILFAVVISIPIAKTTEVQEAKEADYRHAQVRPDSIALPGEATHASLLHASVCSFG